MSEITNEQTVELSELLQIRRDKLAELQENGKNPYDYVKYDVDSSTKEIIENFESFEGKSVSLGGRLMSKRGMGKAS
ncbi:MAG: lysine--tRNA ligase, partial [Clostridia bacterium]|nr:lysine--tRNA ligase [Clostridia bacterium]